MSQVVPPSDLRAAMSQARLALHEALAPEEDDNGDSYEPPAAASKAMPRFTTGPPAGGEGGSGSEAEEEPCLSRGLMAQGELVDLNDLALLLDVAQVG